MAKLLYVEDNEMNRDMLSRRLQRRGHEVLIAVDGEEGIAQATAEKPDLILMDIQLPKISGLDATRELRVDPNTAHIPIIAITSFALSGDSEKAKDAGATAYLAKPYSPRELLQLIRELAPEN